VKTDTPEDVWLVWNTHTVGNRNCSERKLLSQTVHYSILANITQIVTLSRSLCRTTQQRSWACPWLH